MLQALASLEAVLLQTVYNTKMASVGLSDIVMDTTVTHTTIHGRAHSVEECRYLPQWDCEPWDALWGRGELAGSVVPAAILLVLSPQMPHWLFWFVL